LVSRRFWWDWLHVYQVKYISQGNTIMLNYINPTLFNWISLKNNLNWLSAVSISHRNKLGDLGNNNLYINKSCVIFSCHFFPRQTWLVVPIQFIPTSILFAITDWLLNEESSSNHCYKRLEPGRIFTRNTHAGHTTMHFD